MTLLLIYLFLVLWFYFCNFLLFCTTNSQSPHVVSASLEAFLFSDTKAENCYIYSSSQCNYSFFVCVFSVKLTKLMGIMCVISEVIFLQLAIFYTLLLIRLPVRLLQQYQPSEILMKPHLHLNLAYLCRVPHYIKSSRKFWWKSSLLRTKVYDQ